MLLCLPILSFFHANQNFYIEGSSVNDGVQDKIAKIIVFLSDPTDKGYLFLLTSFIKKYKGNEISVISFKFLDV
jgi:hypothetical protein